MTEKIDARGMECPKPVIMTKKALEEGATELQVRLDNQVACDNVSRLADKLDCSVETRALGKEFVLKITRSKESKIGEQKRTDLTSMVFINSNSIGRGSEELGEALLKAFLATLIESSNKPEKIVFMNSGVKLVANGSDCLESLRSLEDQGIEVLACGTCLDYFNLKDQLATGKISNMYDILDSMLEADKVITI